MAVRRWVLTVICSALVMASVWELIASTAHLLREDSIRLPADSTRNAPELSRWIGGGRGRSRESAFLHEGTLVLGSPGAGGFLFPVRRASQYQEAFSFSGPVVRLYRFPPIVNYLGSTVILLVVGYLGAAGVRGENEKKG